MSSKPKKKTGTGGMRPGAGRKAEVDGLRQVTVTLDPVSIAIAKALGDDNMSLGVREALRLVAEAPSKLAGKADK